jgi:hypothetical protein
LNQIQQIKQIEKTIDTQLADGEYQKLIKVLKEAGLDFLFLLLIM